MHRLHLFVINSPLILCLLLGTLFRISGIAGELWLDEIWNIEAVKNLTSPLQIYFGQQRLDGHSSLWSVILWILGPGLPDYLYRMPNFLMSIALLLVIAFFYDRPQREKHFFLFLTATSYLLTLYGTEARGYAGMLLFTTASFITWRKLPDTHSPLLACSFAISTIIGFLFHYSQIMWVLALFLTETCLAVKNKKLPSRIQLSAWGTILCCIAIMYLLVLRYIPEGSGPLPAYHDSYISALSLTFGGPSASAETPNFVLLTLMATLLTVGIAVYEIKQLLKTNTRLALIFLNGIFIAPIALISVLQPSVVMPRYFLTASLLWLALFASFCNRHPKLACLPLILFTIGNLWLQSSLYLWGRGNYHQVVSSLRAETPEINSILVDHTFRHKTMLDYYFKNQFRVINLFNADPEEVSVEDYPWLVAHSLDWAPAPNPIITTKSHFQFKLSKIVPSTDSSGWSVLIYRKVAKKELINQ